MMNGLIGLTMIWLTMIWLTMIGLTMIGLRNETHGPTLPFVSNVSASAFFFLYAFIHMNIK
jgi:hypothetical protein